MRLKAFKLVILLCSFLSASAQVTLTGRVVSEEGAAVGDAEVYVKGPGIRTVTQADGTFEVNALQPGPVTLVVFAFEYQVYEQDLTGGPGGTAGGTICPSTAAEGGGDGHLCRKEKRSRIVGQPHRESGGQ